jgi:hypothetical protein
VFAIPASISDTTDIEEGFMFAPRFVLAAALTAALATTAAAQSTLRIGLAEDPDILDPTLART